MEYLQRAGFLDLAVQVVGGLPPMDGPLLTAMVDRWRLKTHMFHLPFGEMTITMQDVAMILSLPLDGQPVTGIIQNENLRDMVEMHIGIRPPEPEDGDNSKKTSGVSSTWLREHFNVCPPGANDEVVQRYARVWLWHFVSTFLLPDAAGNTVSWMVLPILGQHWDNIALYSWGLVALAWLYRQLCEACRRTARDSNVEGCTYMLQIWILERMPMGRPSRLRVNHVRPVRGNPDRRYRAYTNEFDVLTQHQVEWKPYDREQLSQIVFSPTCYRDRELWRCTTPMILYYVASEDSEGEQSEDDDPTYGEELEISGMIDAPPVTQM
uniref:Aminotransferase-like plant mobile domain-containing protein n=1 Tax=Setaria italica TaxID=4555 RepID=K3Y399_SETIT